MRPFYRVFLFCCFCWSGAACESYFEPDERELTPLEIESVYPAMNQTGVIRNEAIRIKLNKHLNSNFFSTRGLDLHSGSYGKWLMAYYSPLDMELVIWTSSSLLPNTVWELWIDDEFRALDGSHITPGLVTRFQTGPDKTDTAVYEKRTYLDDVKPVFDAHCIRCHGKDGMAGLDLRGPKTIADTVVNVPSAQWPELERIVPARPGGSYLMYKLVDNDNISGRVMPRTMPQSTLDQSTLVNEVKTVLSMKEKRTIMEWILSGTPF